MTRKDVPALAVSLLLAAGAKVAYGRMGPDELRFLTAPTQAIVSLATGIDFSYEAGYGYASLARRLVIAKSCTGVNYLLAAFGLLAFTMIPAPPRPRTKMTLVLVAAAGACAATVVVNAVRIALGVMLHEGGFAWGWMTAARVHRLAGIVVYFLSLVALHAAARFATAPQRAVPAGAPLLVIPLVSYGVVVLAFPVLSGAFLASPGLFAEHCAWVLGVTLLVWACFKIGRPGHSLRNEYER